MLHKSEIDKRRQFYQSVHTQLRDVHRKEPTNEEVLLTMVSFLSRDVSDVKGMLEEIYRMKVLEAQLNREVEQMRDIKGMKI